MYAQELRRLVSEVINERNEMTHTDIVMFTKNRRHVAHLPVRNDTVDS